MTRAERRQNDPEVQKRREQFAAGNLIGPSLQPGQEVTSGKGSTDAGGWGNNAPGAKPASGQTPNINPFIIPKGSGINMISQTFPSNYYVEWNLSTWRAACDQAIKMGLTMSYATLASWAYESSPFIQSLFTKLGAAMDKMEFFIVDQTGNKLDDLTMELCQKPWQMELRREIMFSFFWGFSGLNFDPFQEKIYKYPMQDIDPINRMLRQSTYSFYDGARFADNDNLIFVQPSTSYEAFLGWMQPITRSYIMMNQSKNNWLSAGRRLAFPLMTVGYPQNDGAIDGSGVAEFNPLKEEALDVASNIDPSKGLVYPYTRNAKGEIEKSLEVEYESPKTGANMHKIFSEFNADERDEIRELVLGGTLSSSNNKDGAGSRSLGEVHERMYQAVVESKADFILAILNSDFLPKIAKWYKKLPEGIKYDINRAKAMSIEQMAALSPVVVANGYRFSLDFFEANGLAKEFLEDKPEPTIPPGFGGKPDASKKDDKEKDVEMAKPARTIFGAKKKYSSVRSTLH